MNSEKLKHLALSMAAKSKSEVRFDSDQHAAALAMIPSIDEDALSSIAVACAENVEIEKYRNILAKRISADTQFVALNDCLLSLQGGQLVSDSIAFVLVDLALNRVSKDHAVDFLADAFRVLKKDSRITILAFAADEPVERQVALMGKNLAYIPLEKELEQLLIAAGYYGVEYFFRATTPTKIVWGGVEIRLLGITAKKGKQGACIDFGHAVIYRGPWAQVCDDDGHTFLRGVRSAVCEKTYRILTVAPYAEHFIGVPPYLHLTEKQARPFDCNVPLVRDPKITKGLISLEPSPCCDSSVSICC